MSLPFFFTRQDRDIQDVLMAHAEALVTGAVDVDHLLDQLDRGTRSQVEDLFALAEQLSQTLTLVAPSEEFVAELRRQLLSGEGLRYMSLLGRWRQLPPRTQIAAGIGGATLTAGVMLIAARSMSDVLDSWRSRREATA